MDWVPTLKDRSGPLYQRIVEALAADIAQGRLRRGQQLPTHRALAKALGIDLTTVTHAYSEARRRGLTTSRAGSGTFVAETLAQQGQGSPRGSPPGLPPWASFDLSMNLPPQPLAADLEGRITRGIAALQEERGFSAYLNYRATGGSAEERDIAARWLGARIPQLSAERVVICPGTQCALTCVLMTMTTPGDVILTESLTYPGIMATATSLGLRIVGVETDGAGILPDALRAACRRHKPKAVYLVPTIHNPTTVTMTPARRKEVASVLRDNAVPLIEDDAYGLLEPKATPIAALIPELTYIAVSLSKCIAPGLRFSLLVAPDDAAAERIKTTLRAVLQMPVALTGALVTRWLADGSADAIIAAIREEAAARQALARQALKGVSYAAHPHGHHVWVTLPRAWTRPAFAAHVQRQGLAIVTSDAFSAGGEPPHAIRVALGAAASRSQLVAALDVLASALKSPVAAGHVV